MPATWNAGSGSEIYAQTSVASGIIPNQTKRPNAGIMLTSVSRLAAKTETVDTVDNAGMNQQQ